MVVKVSGSAKSATKSKELRAASRSSSSWAAPPATDSAVKSRRALIASIMTRLIAV